MPPPNGKKKRTGKYDAGQKIGISWSIMRGRKYGILRLILEGKIAGNRSIGRRRKSRLRILREWFGCTLLHLFRTAVSKVKIAIRIADSIKRWHHTNNKKNIFSTTLYLPKYL